MREMEKWGKKMDRQKRTEVNGTYLMGQMGWVMWLQEQREPQN
jgi:hypothetical protein